MPLYDNDKFTHAGHTYRLNVTHDHDAGRPWAESCGHGPVREASRGYSQHVTKAPGERVLHHGGRNEYTWVYDWAGAMVEARRDGWGLREDKRPANWDSLTAGQRATLAVQADFDFLQGWCSGQWEYVGLTVTRLDDEGEPVGGPASLWGVETVCSSYIEQVAHELAAEAAPA